MLGAKWLSSLHCSHEPATVPYPWPEESSPNLKTLLPHYQF